MNAPTATCPRGHAGAALIVRRDRQGQRIGTDAWYYCRDCRMAGAPRDIYPAATVKEDGA